MIGKFVYKYLWASDIDKSAACDAQNYRANESRRIINADADSDSCGLNQRETEEYQKDSFLRFGLMLAERDTQGDDSCRVVQGHTDHEVHEGCHTFAHAKGYAFEDRVDTQSQEQDQRRDVDTAH